jgi:hypothetical protein
MNLSLAPVIMITICISACDQPPQYEDYKLQTWSEIGLITQNDHPHGWQQKECFNCHVKANMHQVNRLQHPLFDYAKDEVNAKDLESCHSCHGWNGVEEWKSK